jgi:hypothetical protein
LGSHGGKYEVDLSSGMLRRVVSYKLADVSEVLSVSNMRAISPDDNIAEDNHHQNYWLLACLFI